MWVKIREASKRKSRTAEEQKSEAGKAEKQGSGKAKTKQEESDASKSRRHNGQTKSKRIKANQHKPTHNDFKCVRLKDPLKMCPKHFCSGCNDN